MLAKDLAEILLAAGPYREVQVLVKDLPLDKLLEKMDEPWPQMFSVDKIAFSGDPENDNTKTVIVTEWL